MDGSSRSVLARIQVTDASSKAVYSCYSIADGDVDIDLTVVGILMQVQAVTCKGTVNLKQRLVELRTAVVE